MTNRAEIAAVILLGLLAGCAGTKVGFIVERPGKVPVELVDGITLIPFQQVDTKESEIEAGRELTNLMRRILEAERRLHEVKVVKLTELETPVASAPADWVEAPETAPWKVFQQELKAPLVLFGTVRFDAYDYTGFVTETVEDPYTGRPVRRTVKKELANYTYKVTIVLGEVDTRKVVYEKVYDNRKTVEGKLNIYDFFEILEPELRSFVDKLFGEKRIEKRKLLR
ncbi:hypothetical protein JW905_03690 [bacterium]|nr:hypothetical protein [candidate division CSSED10-310 bacterium]